MNKRALREDIETIMRLLPRPQLNDAPLAKAKNFWLIVEEYEDGEESYGGRSKSSVDVSHDRDGRGL